MTYAPNTQQPDHDGMRAWRQHLHQNPEIGHETPQTAAFVADKLSDWGYEVTKGIGGHGVVATRNFGDGSGPKIGLRADMDALPMTEKTGLPYASSIAGRMHACGHDGHTAMLLGGADLIARRADAGEMDGNGRIVLIFQPAEEVGGGDSGAVRMIEDGLFDRFDCDAVYGIHNDPVSPEGLVSLREGPFMFSSDTVEILISGLSSHGATPHLAKDASLAMAAVLMGLHTITSQNIDPLDRCILTVGVAEAGTAFNVIPGEARILLSVRTTDKEIAAKAHNRIKEIATAQASAFGCGATVNIQYGNPPVVNDAGVTQQATATAIRLFGEGKVNPDGNHVTASEDFAFYGQERPSTFLIIGNGECGHKDGKNIGQVSVHSPYYDFNDNILPIGAAFWAGLVEDIIQKGETNE